MTGNQNFLPISNSVLYPFKNKSLDPFPNEKFQTLPNLEFADDNFRFDKNGQKLSLWIKNTERKGEIASCEQFLFFPSVIKRLILQTRKNQGFFGKGLSLPNMLSESPKFTLW